MHEDRAAKTENVSAFHAPPTRTRVLSRRYRRVTPHRMGGGNLRAMHLSIVKLSRFVRMMDRLTGRRNLAQFVTNTVAGSARLNANARERDREKHGARICSRSNSTMASCGGDSTIVEPLPRSSDSRLHSCPLAHSPPTITSSRRVVVRPDGEVGDERVQRMHRDAPESFNRVMQFHCRSYPFSLSSSLSRLFFSTRYATKQSSQLGQKCIRDINELNQISSN